MDLPLITQAVIDACLPHMNKKKGALGIFRTAEAAQPALAKAVVAHVRYHEEHAALVLSFSMTTLFMLHNAREPLELPEVRARETAIVAAEIMRAGQEDWLLSHQPRLALRNPVFIAFLTYSAAQSLLPPLALEAALRVLRAFELCGQVTPRLQLRSIER
jgi:hypothetical protein